MDSPWHTRLAEHRHVEANDLRRDPTLLDAYPHRYVFVAARPRRFGTAPAGGTLPLLLSCVETLERLGWEPVAWELSRATLKTGVLMRRRAG